LRGSFAAGRIAALVAIAAAAALALALAGSDEQYEVTAEFENASQLVPGNQVVVGGVAAGSVKEIELGDDGQALVTFSVDEQYAPLERGTTATVRSPSLSGVANRQVQLTLPPDSRAGARIPAGGTLSQAETVSEVDLDEVFNTLDERTVADFKRVVQGLELSLDGVGPQANRSFRYLNPFLSTSRGLFAELTRDERVLESLIVDSAKLSGALAERAPDLSALVSNLDSMMGAISARKLALAESVRRLPGFMREANTTFVNLRAALDDAAPLVEASKPAARELRRFLPLLRAAAADAVPTIRDLDALVRRRGSANDLVELTRDQVGLARRAVGQGSPDCGTEPSEHAAAADGDFRQGAFGESACALRDSNSTLAMFRPYAPELVGWFDDFSHPGTFDALGAVGRIGTSFNQFTASASGLPDLGAPVSPAELLDTGIVQTGLDDKCPGANERPLPAGLGQGGVPYDEGGAIDCDPGDVLEQP
jgi:phospholipid/cholesterol/gamma-HCH transport system substrate-binding protein